ncbi:unnamed protein product [Paramecium sonneborni]|uniref:Uncharacterized protein n=1 Tax=Paramecium sonneborni TaxID=65129 RepID=A0A8S1RNL7_9CILI|nr:unnamed protein product [Paramecium sonneborni]
MVSKWEESTSTYSGNLKDIFLSRIDQLSLETLDQIYKFERKIESRKKLIDGQVEKVHLRELQRVKHKFNTKQKQTNRKLKEYNFNGRKQASNNISSKFPSKSAKKYILLLQAAKDLQLFSSRAKSNQ